VAQHGTATATAQRGLAEAWCVLGTRGAWLSGDFFLHTPASHVWIGKWSGFCFWGLFEYLFAAGLVSWRGSLGGGLCCVCVVDA
jgi:hypothetical protein